MIPLVLSLLAGSRDLYSRPTQAVCITMLKKAFFLLVYVFFSLFAVVYATTSIISSNPKILIPVYHAENQRKASYKAQSPVRLLSLNIAHGRGQAFNQFFLQKKELKQNLLNIAGLIEEQAPHLVALQEADGPSFWSKRFNHVKFLAHFSKFQYSVHGIHVDGAGIQFGTAVLSQIKPSSAYSYTFNPSPPTFAKGFTALTFKWPASPEVTVDFISVHLDYSREYIRNEQIRDIIRYIHTNKRPFIIMGDFNLDWSVEQSKLAEFMRLIRAKTYQAENSSLITFPRRQSRLDWIFVSQGFRIISHQVLQTRLSDHYALIAEVSLESSATEHGRPDGK